MEVPDAGMFGSPCWAAKSTLFAFLTCTEYRVLRARWSMPSLSHLSSLGIVLYYSVPKTNGMIRTGN